MKPNKMHHKTKNIHLEYIIYKVSCRSLTIKKLKFQQLFHNFLITVTSVMSDRTLVTKSMSPVISVISFHHVQCVAPICREVQNLSFMVPKKCYEIHGKPFSVVWQHMSRRGWTRVYCNIYITKVFLLQFLFQTVLQMLVTSLSVLILEGQVMMINTKH